jgi:hypothetical protein
VLSVTLCSPRLSHFDSDDTPEKVESTYTVLIYLSEGAHSTAFPDFKKEELPLPRFDENDNVLNAEEMRVAVERGLLDRSHFKRWGAQLGDVAIFSQGVMHHGTVTAGACPQRITLFSILTKYPEKRQDSHQIHASVTRSPQRCSTAALCA